MKVSQLRCDRWDIYGKSWTLKRLVYRLQFWGEQPWIDPYINR